MARFDLDAYETVGERLDRAHQQYPDIRVITDLVHVQRDDAGKPLQYIVRAQIWIGDVLKAQDFAEEVVGSSPVNKTSALENCATSAIGRALADMNFQGVNPRKTRPSREEMEKVERQSEAPAPAPTPELIADAQEAQSQVADIKTVAELKNFYDGVLQAGLLQIPVNGVTLNSLIAKQKKVLEAKK